MPNRMAYVYVKKTRCAPKPAFVMTMPHAHHAKLNKSVSAVSAMMHRMPVLFVMPPKSVLMKHVTMPMHLVLNAPMDKSAGTTNALMPTILVPNATNMKSAAMINV